MTASMSVFARTILDNKYAHQLNGELNRKETWPEIAARNAHSVMDPYLPDLADKVEGYIRERKFLPGGRYLSSAGRKFPQVNNCMLWGVEDSREGWAGLMSNITNCLMTGGGVGVVYSKLRYEGATINGLGGTSTGPCALMQMVNEAGRHIMQGGSRRSAIWAGLHWNHPDVFKFIKLKEWDDATRERKEADFNASAPMDGTNISVILDDEFFAAYRDHSHLRHDLACDVFWDVIRRMLRTGEPGFSVDVGDNAGEHYRNACLTGDTLVAVADGRGAVPIRDLVGTETRVYSSTPEGSVRIGTLENVRVTRKNAPVVKLILDDGSIVRLTADHEIMRLDGRFVEAGKLRHGDKLMPFWSKVRQKYRWVGCRKKGAKACWLAVGRVGGENDGMDVHHVNEDFLDDRPENLKVINHGVHASIKMVGTKNPASRLAHDEGWRVRKSRATTGVKNGRYTDGAKTESRVLSLLHDSIPEHRTYDKVCEECGDEFQTRNSGARVCSKSCAGKIGTKDKVISRAGRTIVSVKADGREDVYDGLVQGLHCFAIVTSGGADGKEATRAGMVVHNCTEVTSKHTGDMCNLGSINLARISSIQEMLEVTEATTAFLLCGTLYSKLPIESMYRVREKNRRLGLGLMGVHEWLLKRGKRYEPDDELGAWLKVYARSGGYANRFADQLGISRPVATRAVAPTGTISIIAETTSGIEPIYAVAFKRRYLDGKQWKAQYVVDAAAERLIADGVNPDLIEDAVTLAEDVERRMKFQAWVQQYVDHGISSTINLPPWGSPLNNEAKVTSFGNTLMKYLPLLRGITAYPDGSRGGQPLTRVPYEEARGMVGVEFVDNSGAGCKSGVCGD